MMARGLPPYGSGSDAPCTVESRVRMKFCPRSYSCSSGSVLLLMLNCRIGTLDASYLTMLGGKIPGGRFFKTVCETAVIWAIANSGFTLGRKKTRITAAPV